MLIVHLFALMALGLLFGFTVHGGFLLLFALGFGGLVIVSLLWLYLLATKRTGFFGRRL